MNSCPNSRDSNHHYTYNVGTGIKGEFEPQSYGDTMEDTLYKRVEYSVLACSCGTVKKERIVLSLS